MESEVVPVTAGIHEIQTGLFILNIIIERICNSAPVKCCTVGSDIGC